MIDRISREWHLPVEVLAKPYRLQKPRVRTNRPKMATHRAAASAGKRKMQSTSRSRKAPKE
jgi:hypothetical protein